MAAKTATKAAGNRDKAAKRAMPEGKRFQPGQSGNPDGRPKTKFISDALKKAVNPEELVEGLIKLALKAKEPAIRLAATKYIMDRIEGTPLHRSEVTIDDVRETARRMAREQGEDEEAAVREAEAIFRGERV